jgi:hypothetical protein
MSLLSTDIAKVQKLSLKEVKLPSPELIAEPVKRESPPTAEERAYSRLVEKYPLFLEAVELLDLVSPTTGLRVRKVDPKPSRETLIALAKRLIKGEAIHSKEEIIEAIKTGSKVSQERAEKGFSLMLEAGAFESIGDSYYLTGSTPF